MDVTIRTGRPADAAPISDLVLPLVAAYVAPGVAPEARPRFLRGFSPEAIEGYLAPPFRYHVAEMDGRLVGAVATRDESHLYHLFVARELHGRGLGRRLWQVARDALRAAGHRGDFTVNASPFATGFYGRLGFTRDGPEQSRDGVVAVPMRLRASLQQQSGLSGDGPCA